MGANEGLVVRIRLGTLLVGKVVIGALGCADGLCEAFISRKTVILT